MAKAIQMDAKRIRRMNRELWERDREHAKDAAYKLGIDDQRSNLRRLRDKEEQTMREQLDEAAWEGHYNA